MLPPDQRQLLLDLLRPEPGYRLERALGTTFTLDLDSLMQVPVAFLHQSGLLRREDGQLDPLTILEALRRFAGRLTIFAQAGCIKLPSKDLPRLATLLEPCVCEVQAPTPKGLFHPKVWVLRYERTMPDEVESRVRYRVLCLSRNLTFDRSWDTAIALDGELRKDLVNKIGRNAPLSEFIASLPDMALQPLDGERLRSVVEMTEELRKVKFTPPEGFDELAFHHGGLLESQWPFPTSNERVLIVSPFIKDKFLRRFNPEQVTLVSRFEELNQCPQPVLHDCERLFMMSPRATGDDLDTSTEAETELEGLHAKVFVIDEGWYARVFSGSFNATNAAFEQNVEFMVEMRGLKSKHGVLAMVPEARQRKKGEKPSPPCLGDLLDIYHIPDQATAPDDEQARWEEACDAARLAVIEAAFELHLSPCEGGYSFALRGRSLITLPGEFYLWIWPATVSSARACELPDTGGCELGVFTEDAITAWIAFELRQGPGEGARRKSWLIKTPLIGAPADRDLRVLTSLIRSRQDLIRFLLLMLSLDEQEPTVSAYDDLDLFIKGRAGGPEATPPLLETLLRTAHQSPQTLHRVADLMQDLRRTTEGSVLEDEDLRQLWEPIWEAVQP